MEGLLQVCGKGKDWWAFVLVERGMAGKPVTGLLLALQCLPTVTGGTQAKSLLSQWVAKWEAEWTKLLPP